MIYLKYSDLSHNTKISITYIFEMYSIDALLDMIYLFEIYSKLML